MCDPILVTIENATLYSQSSRKKCDPIQRLITISLLLGSPSPPGVVVRNKPSLRKQPFILASCRLWTFHEEELLDIPQKLTFLL